MRFTRTWLAISLQTFGGPAGQIAVMQRTLVDQKRWIEQERFLHALNYCMLLPGPEAHQLSVYIGWLMRGIRGGLIAGTLFVLPGFLAMLALSAIYVRFGALGAVSALFGGLAAAVLAIVADALRRLVRRGLTSGRLLLIAMGSFLALAAFAVPFPIVIAAAGIAGWLLARRDPPPAASSRSSQEIASPRRTVRVLLAGLALWITPVAMVILLTGSGSTLTRQGIFFSGAALVTFGGAYAVLTFVAARAVEVYGWLSATDMVRGLALAETTPGPLIMVVQFVAFLGAYHYPGSLNPWVAGLLASLLTVWVTFVPSFLFVFAGAPYMERLRSNHSLTSALTGITAAVVGVIANLALYFSLNTLFASVNPFVWGPVRGNVPVLATFRPVAAAITVVAAIALLRLRWSLHRVLGLSALLGLAGSLCV